MQVPGNWETRGPARLRRRRLVHADVRLAAGAPRRDALARPDRQHRGSVGQRLDGDARRRRRPRARRRRRGGGPPVYALPAGTLKPARTYSPSAFRTRGTTAASSAARGDGRGDAARAAAVPLAGPWQYRVERQTNAGALYAKPGELSAHVALPPAARRRRRRRRAAAAAAQAPDVVLRLGVDPGPDEVRRRADRRAGQLVEVVFVNADEMPHNFVLGDAGLARDASAPPPTPSRRRRPGSRRSTCRTLPRCSRRPAARTRPDGDHPVPRAGAGRDVPYVCTFPAHWRVMNGVLKVVERR